MKKGLLSLLLFCSLCAIAQKDIPVTPFMDLPDSTAIGIPDGNLVSKEIGPTGGTIISDDGRIELNFPAEALIVPTTISIQPTTNLAPNGSGKAYWFEPSGIQFRKPVQIIFHYSEKESEICPPDWMSLAVQDHKGKWTFIDYDELDSVAKTLKGLIHHFSGASNINDIEIKVEKYRGIRVKDSTVIEVVDIRRSHNNNDLELAELERNAPVLWYANSKLNGDDHNGRIRAAQGPVSKSTKIMVALYTAPEYMPKENAVTIWAEIYRRTKKGKILRKRLSNYIVVYDSYKVSLIHEFTGRVGFGSKLVDKASFVTYIYPNKIVIDEIINNPAMTAEEGSRITITEKIYDDNAPGTIDIKESIKDYKLSKDFPPEVYIELETSDVLHYTLQYLIRRMGIETEKVRHSQKAIPASITFTAHGRVQQYHDRTNPGLQVTVTPYTRQ